MNETQTNPGALMQQANVQRDRKNDESKELISPTCTCTQCVRLRGSDPIWIGRPSLIPVIPGLGFLILSGIGLGIAPFILQNWLVGQALLPAQFTVLPFVGAALLMAGICFLAVFRVWWRRYRQERYMLYPTQFIYQTPQGVLKWHTDWKQLRHLYNADAARPSWVHQLIGGGNLHLHFHPERGSDEPEMIILYDLMDVARAGETFNERIQAYAAGLVRVENLQPR